MDRKNKQRWRRDHGSKNNEGRSEQQLVVICNN